MISSIDKIYCNFDNPIEKEPKKEKESKSYELMVFMFFNDKVSLNGCLIFP
jgi:hypothetical protein